MTMKKGLGCKGVQRQHHDASSIATSVGKKACPGTKQHWIQHKNQDLVEDMIS